MARLRAAINKAFLVGYWNRALESFWFVPALMGLAAVAAANGMLWLDASFGERWERKGFGYGGSPEGAAAILQTVASSMITIAGVVFSITLVTLSLASSQFGSRLMRNFMADKLNQVVLGMFAATFLYSILVLREVRRGGGVVEDFVPHMAVAGSVMLAVASIALLIYFIHHVSVSIQADQVIHNVAGELERSIERMFPERVGEPAPGPGDSGLDADALRPEAAFAVRSEDDGYVQVVEPAGLMRIAVKHDLVLRLEARPGDYVVAGGLLARAWPRERIDAQRGADIAACFGIGSQRTPDQDLAFLFNQLVEVAVRALSPGINDPFTAVTCLHRLASELRRLAGREMPATRRSDEEGRLRVLAEPISFAGLVDDVFDPIRRHASGEAMVGMHMLGAIALVAAAARRGEDRECLRRKAAEVHRAFEEETHDLPDRQRLLRAFEAARAACEQGRGEATGPDAKP